MSLFVDKLFVISILEAFFFEAFNTFTDYFFRFFYISPSEYFGCSWLFKIFVMSKMKFYFLFPSFADIIECFNTISSIAIIFWNTNNLVIHFSVIFKIKNTDNFCFYV